MTPQDFAEASWCIRHHGEVVIPTSYPRGSVSQLMWHYAQRTHRDLLPPHFRTQPLYFRRPPKLPQRAMKDAHLLVMRELAAQPGMNSRGLQQSTGLAEAPLARFLSALYVVGAITSNAKRAFNGVARATTDASASSEQSAMYSVMDSAPPPSDLKRPPTSDMTAPMPLMPSDR